MFLCVILSPAISVSPGGIISDRKTLPMEEVEIPIAPEQDRSVVLSDAEDFSYVSRALSHPTAATLGYIDGKALGETGFSVTNLQSDNNVDAIFTEVMWSATAAFEYFFEIDTSQHGSWLQSSIQVEGFVSGEPEQIDISYSTTIGGTYTPLISFLSTDTTRISLSSDPISITTDTIYVRFVDTWRAPLEPVSQWKFDYVRVKFSDARTTNDRIKIDKLFDTDNLYPGRGYGTNSFYKFTVYVHDADGGDTIDNVRLTYENQITWWVEWSSITSWDESNTPNYIQHITSQSSTTIIGSELRVTFAVQFRFGHPEENNVDWKLRSESATSSDEDEYSTIYDSFNNLRDVDIHTAIEWYPTPHLSVEKCDPDTTIDFTGALKFTVSAGTMTGADVRAEVTRTDPTSPSWSGYDIFTDGGFLVPCETYGPAGSSNTFEVSIIDIKSGSTLLGPVSDSVLLDSVVAYDYGRTDGWLNTGAYTTIYTKLRYYSDSGATNPITGGSVEWNGVGMEYLNGRWEASVSAAIPTTSTYDTITVSTPEGIHTVDTHPNTTIIWDRVKVLSYNAYRMSDYIEIYHIDLEELMYVDVQLQYEEQGGWVTDGSVTINGYQFVYTGSDGIWRYDNLKPSIVSILTLDNVVCTGNTPDITSVNQNGQSCTIIWDTFMVELSTEDAVIDKGSTVRIWAEVTRAYDGSVFTDSGGNSLVLHHSTSGDFLMNYNTTEKKWFIDVVQFSNDIWNYFIYNITDNEFGLTTIGRGLHFDGIDDYVDCGSDPSLELVSDLSISLWFYGTGSSWDSGKFLLSKKEGNDATFALYVLDDGEHFGGTLRFVYSTTVLIEVDLHYGVSRNAWHHLVVTIEDNNLNSWFDGIHVKDDFTLNSSLTFYPDFPLYLGAEKSGSGTIHEFDGHISEVLIYGEDLSDAECKLLYFGQYPSASDCRLFLSRTSFNVYQNILTDWSSYGNNGNPNGVTVELGTIPAENEERVSIIWTQIIVSEFSTDQTAVDIGTTSSNHLTLYYAHDGSLVTDGNVSVNGIPAEYSGADGIWDFGEYRATYGSEIYDTVSYEGGCFDVTSVIQSIQSLEQVWDEIYVIATMTTSSITDIGTMVEIRVVARLSHYNSHYLGAGDTISMNNEPMQWNSIGLYFYYQAIQTTVGTWTYYVNSTNANEQTYGISTINTNSQNASTTWDGLIINITDPYAQYVNLYENASGIHYSVTYASDGTPYDGTVILNDTQFMHSDVGKRGYSLTSFLGDDSRGITAIVSNDETWCVWDAIIISISDPFPQNILVGENATGIYVTAVFASDGSLFDGTLSLNNTVFSYDTTGKRGYAVELVVPGIRGISYILVNDETFAIWCKEQATLHLGVQSTDILVSTLYDPTSFDFEIWLTNSTYDQISGLVTLTIDGSDFDIHCTSEGNASFTYHPETAGSFSVEAIYWGDYLYSVDEARMNNLVAHIREMTCSGETPDSVISMSETSFSVISVFDNEFQGSYDSVTYIRDYPINATFSVWWTLSPDYSGPMVYVGTWSITSGEGTALLTMPWDLNGDGQLTNDDLTAYLRIEVDGAEIYENDIIERTISICHPLQAQTDIGNLRYSDVSTISVQLSPVYGEIYSIDLTNDVEVYLSTNNRTWVHYDTIHTNSTGYGIIERLCNETGILFFRLQSIATDSYVECASYADTEVQNEATLLSIEQVSEFTYSDQGVIVAQLTTDDGESIAYYSVFLELMDGTWVSIGSGITNDTGHVSLLWTPTLPSGNYSIRLLALVTESQFYDSPERITSQLSIGKESIIIEVDSTTINQGYVRVHVTDDDDTSVGNIPVVLSVGNDRHSEVTDDEGYASFDLTLNDGQLVKAEVQENAYYQSAVEEVEIIIPPDTLGLTLGVGGIFSVMVVLGVARKIQSGRVRPTPPAPVSPEVAEELRKERESVPERIKAHTERRREDISEIDEDGE